jgi:hypothetical protein
MQKTSLVVAFFLAAVLAGVFVNFGLLKAPAPAQKETFMQKTAGMPLSSGGMGPYDSVNLAGGFSGWGATEAAPILDGAPAGSSSNPNQLMYLVGNKTDPDCCPAAFNTDSGCVCLSEQDKNFMASRGGNRA